MDYGRIYCDFINDRLQKQPSDDEYYEVHHIVPKAKNGSDEGYNLIRLTPEDHFFAHLLLAHCYGRRMWLPVLMMTGGEIYKKKDTFGRFRKKYGWLKRAISKSTSGRNAHQFDKTVYTLKHEDGRTWVGHQIDMPNEIGISKPLANMLVKGRVKSAKGWSFSGRGKQYVSGKDHPMYSDKIYRFKHDDGTEFVGTQFDMNRVHGLNRSACSMLVNGKSQRRKGWRLCEAIA